MAVPSRFDMTASPIMKGIGLILSLLHKAKAIGAITKTVATFSTKIEIIPVITRISTTAIPVEGAAFTIQSAIRIGTFE